MRTLIYHPSMLKVKENCIKIAPEKTDYFIRLEKNIAEHPEAGIPDTCLLRNGKSIVCYRRTIKLYVFSGRIRYDRSQLTAQYLFNDESVIVINLYFSV